jgi:hypothetical protein
MQSHFLACAVRRNMHVKEADPCSDVQLRMTPTHRAQGSLPWRIAALKAGRVNAAAPLSNQGRNARHAGAECLKCQGPPSMIAASRTTPCEA